MARGWTRPRPAGWRACDDETLICRGIIYGIPVWEISAKTGMIILYAADPATGALLLDDDGQLRMVGLVPTVQLQRPDARPRIVLDYIGQTIRELQVRESEHEEDKCWADLKAGPAMVLEQGMWDRRTRDGKEVAQIHLRRPRFNRDHNENNPQRIEIWRQKQLRHARDRAAGRELWLELEQRSVAARAAAERAVIGAGLDGVEPRYPLTIIWQGLTAAAGWVLSWPRRARLAALAVLGWAMTTLVLADALLAAGFPRPAAGIAAALTCALLLAAVPRKRRRRRRRR
jgi:hypothetical protein